MTFDQAAILVVLAVALALFISERVRYDLVALGALLVSVLLGLVEPGMAFAGFANDAVITVAAVLVMSQALARSGAVDAVTAPLLRVATHPVALMTGLCVIGALLSSFMNNVGALALLMPLAIAGARKGGYSASLLLMPLSFATLLGGTTTLIGTPPNLLAADLAERLRGEPFTMFEFAPVGAAITVAGIAFIVTVGWRMLPRGREGTKSPTEIFEIGHYVTEARLPAKSSFIGKTILNSRTRAATARSCSGSCMATRGCARARPTSCKRATSCCCKRRRKRYRTTSRRRRSTSSPPRLIRRPTCRPQKLRAGDCTASRPERQDNVADAAIARHGRGRRHADSWVQGSTARNLRLRARYDTNLLAISRRGRPVTTRLRDVPLHAGDVLLLEGPAGDLPTSSRRSAACRSRIGSSLCRRAECCCRSPCSSVPSRSSFLA